MAEDSLIDISAQDVSKLKVPDLKRELKNRGLSTTGNKNELVERLQTALKASDVMDDIEEDLLNDDDDEHLDEGSESVINDLDHDLEDSPGTQKRKLPEITDKSDVNIEPPKKVILNRNNSTGNALSDTQIKESDTTLTPKSESNGEERKVIKLSEISVKERLEMRAKKFGVTAISDDAKKLARAERFGTNGDSQSSKTSSNLDVLKQRAARFGSSVSSAASDSETQEKLEKRKQRFGDTTNGASDNEKAKAARLERFKQPVK